MAEREVVEESTAVGSMDSAAKVAASKEEAVATAPAPAAAMAMVAGGETAVEGASKAAAETVEMEVDAWEENPVAVVMAQAMLVVWQGMASGAAAMGMEGLVGGVPEAVREVDGRVVASMVKVAMGAVSLAVDMEG